MLHFLGDIFPPWRVLEALRGTLRCLNGDVQDRPPPPGSGAIFAPRSPHSPHFILLPISLTAVAAPKCSLKAALEVLPMCPQWLQRTAQEAPSAYHSPIFRARFHIHSG